MRRCLMDFARTLFIALAWALGASLHANAGWFSFGDRWKEEARLHDGRTIIVERYQNYGRNNLIGQPPPFHEQTLRFSLPNVDRVFEWAAPYDEFNGQSDLIILAVHVLKNTPYIITAPNLCIDYNKWNRPNPPYVVFEWKEGAWQRIPWGDVPTEFHDINLTTGERVQLGERPAGTNTIPADVIARWNTEASLPQFKKILREPLNPAPGCIPMITNGKGLWLTRERFSRMKDLEACQRECYIKKFEKETCPCREIFEGRREDPPRVTAP
ncbi:hypothetical protein KGA65_08205 [Ideonella sp. B7]|uniref:hypothetical protein n=1 Tax=Ideonella benzenivorans TaxID=2831643 RepID=UPI001CECA856|nr:hypothetical protein [Ideonella benzenivorans]MCA6216518.1 hypothetical protein [Ideonella benzenivorans]